MQFDILIIGAGAAGLMAASELSKKGQHVCVLEADSQPGGRIAYIIHNGVALELGAEFIHGNSPVTDALLKEIGVKKELVDGKMIPVHKGVWFGENSLTQNTHLLTEKLETLDADMTILEFLDENFPAHEYEELRDSVIQFSEGFSLADVQKASVYTLKKEWSQMETEQYRVQGGYNTIVNHLYAQCKEAGVSFFFNTKANEIDHSAENVVVAADSKQFTASNVIVTCSVGVLQSNDLKLVPNVDHVNTAITQMAFGSVIKILLVFKKPFWKTYENDLGFILSDEEIPTWWTQSNESNLLTGWLGGAKAEHLSNSSESMIIKAALRSLSNIFKMKENTLIELLEFQKIVCWQNKPYVKGGYSYTSVFTEEARKMLEEPVSGKIYFAGEAMYTGELGGTVEAALVSGLDAAEKVLLKVVEEM